MEIFFVYNSLIDDEEAPLGSFWISLILFFSNGVCNKKKGFAIMFVIALVTFNIVSKAHYTMNTFPPIHLYMQT